MTQEEIIQAISDDKMMPFIQPEQLAQIVEFVINNYRPSMPADLGEAAENYYEQDCPYPGEARVVNNEHDVWFPSQAIEDAFKAGAQYAAPRWISVDEKLPEMDEEVIVLTDELGTAPIYKISFGHIVNVERCIDYNGWNTPGVKYWMPCPKIPNND